MYFRKALEGVEEVLLDYAVTHPEKVDNKDSSKVAGNAVVNTSPAASDIVQPPPRTYLQKLHLFRLMPDWPTIGQMFTMMYRPLVIFFYFPNVVWAGFLYGASLCLYQVGNATVGFVLGGSPYNWTSDMVGLSYLAGIITALLHV